MDRPKGTLPFRTRAVHPLVIVVFTVLIFSSELTASLAQSILPVALQGQEAPGTSGGVFVSFSDVSLSQAGHITFLAGTTGTSRGGVFLFASGVIVPVALLGEAVPGRESRTFMRFDYPMVNAAGHVTFLGVIDGADGGVFFRADGGLEALYLPPAAGFPRTPVGGLPPRSIYLGASRISFNEGDTVVFSAAIFSQTTGNGSGIFLAEGGTVTKLIWPEDLDIPGIVTALGSPSLNDKGDLVFIATSGRLIVESRIVLLQSGKAALPFSTTRAADPQINNQGQIVFRESLSILLYNSSCCRRLASVGDSVGTGGAILTLLYSPSLNNKGSVAFAGPQGVFIVREGPIASIATAGMGAPGTGGALFGTFGDSVSVNDKDIVAFTASLQGGITSAGLFIGSTSTIGSPRRRP